MNRISSVFFSTVAMCTVAFAQTTNIVDMQITGSGYYPTNYAANIESVGVLNVSGSTLTGGAGGTTTSGAAIEDNGGAGLLLGNVGSANFSNSTFLGGRGGNVAIGSAGVADARGGHGIELENSFDLSTLSDGIVAIGGDGGTTENGSGRAKAFGGNGISWDAVEGSGFGADFLIDGGTYQGGNGGKAVYNSEELLDPASYTAFFGDVNGARGGHGIWLSNRDYVQYGTVLTIDGGTFAGGAGGSAENSGVGDVFANGGHGVFVDFSDVIIYGGEFLGGAGGIENGNKGLDGFGVRTRDSNLTVTNGSFSGNGLFFESHYYDSIANISGGNFGLAVFTATFDEFYSTHDTINTVNISGGSFDQVQFDGEMDNVATLSGGTIGTLLFDGTATNTLSISADTDISGGVVQNGGGSVNFNQWEDSHFRDTLISDGTMNFNGQSFTHEENESFVLGSMDAAVNFNDGLLAKAESEFEIAFDGTDSTAIEGTGLIFEDGARIVVNGGTNSIATGKEITLAIDGDGAISAHTNASFVKYEGTGDGASWAGGFTSLARAGGEWNGTYGFSRVEEALELEPGTVFHQAMSDFSDYVADKGWYDDPDPVTGAGYADLKALSEGEATAVLADGYVRAPEVANTMIQLQGIFADQIKDRTRSYLRYGQWGVATAQAPSGAQGPAWDNTMDWLNDRLPKWDPRDMSDNRNPPKGADTHSPVKTSKINVDVPETYQAWGRAYGSRIEQDSAAEFGGYNANVGGGVIGVDKRFNNMLLGLGGGYAYSTVDGGWGSDAETDTGYGTVYAAVAGEKLYFDINANYAFHSVETEGHQILGYTGEYDANSASVYIGTGLGLDWGKWLFAPEVSLLTTYYDREAYTETSSSTVNSYADKQWDAYSEWSYLGSLGATLSMIQQIDSLNLEMEFQPELRAHWLHEFNADMDNPMYSMTPGSDIAVTLQAREEDLLKVGAGVRFSKWDSDTLEFGLDIDGTFGSEYEAYIISGKLMHRF